MEKYARMTGDFGVEDVEAAVATLSMNYEGTQAPKLGKLRMACRDAQDRRIQAVRALPDPTLRPPTVEEKDTIRKIHDLRRAGFGWCYMAHEFRKLSDVRSPHQTEQCGMSLEDPSSGAVQAAWAAHGDKPVTKLLPAKVGDWYEVGVEVQAGLDEEIPF